MRVLLLTVAIALLYPTSAVALVTTRERPADARVAAAVRTGVSFWADRGVTGCPGGVSATVADSMSEPGVTMEMFGFARIEACSVVLKTGLDDWQLCTMAAHEVGHVFGLRHAPGVMAPHPEPPGACMPWQPPRRLWFHP